MHMKNKINLICERRLERYFSITEKALEIVKKAVIKGKEEQAREIISMAENYLSDAKHFQKTGNWVNAFAAINYAHGWIDCGVRLGIFNVSDNNLFTIK